MSVASLIIPARRTYGTVSEKLGTLPASNSSELAVVAGGLSLTVMSFFPYRVGYGFVVRQYSFVLVVGIDSSFTIGRNLRARRLLRKVSRSTMRDFSWEIKFVSSFLTTVDVLLNGLRIPVHASNVVKVDTGHGRFALTFS
jgi:hypothetical protein